MLKRLLTTAMLLAIAFVASPAFAADDATGTWKWTSMFNNNSIESTLKLKQDGEKLTGVYVGRNNMETAIEDGSVKGDAVSFKIVREINGNKFTMKYSGTLSADTIKGKSEFEREGQPMSRDWEAKRQK